MRIIGLTGGIAAGKSQVSSILKELGATIIDADIVAREIVQVGLPAWKQIKDQFGEEYLLANGEIDRKKLGKLVFSDKKALEKLNDITHPAIKESIDHRIDKLKDQGYNGVLVLDVALLLENGWETMVDEVWVVHAPVEHRVERLMARDNLSKEEALRRINSQMSQQERLGKAHKIIYNTSSFAHIRKQVEDIWNRIIKENNGV